MSARQSVAAPARQAERSGAVVTLSAAALQALQDSEATGATPDRSTGNGSETQDPADPAAAPADRQADGPETASAETQETGNTSDEDDSDQDGLTAEEEEQVDDLKQRDREVRAHEQAHARVGGAYAGAPSYTFQQGPDGGRYAIGGEVQIDTSPERTPEATVRKMQIVIRAALAPAEPSSQDMRVAQQARGQLQQAQSEARAAAAAELQGGDEADSTSASGEAAAGPVGPSASPVSGADARGASQERDDAGTSRSQDERSSRNGSRRDEGGRAASAYQFSAERFAEAGRLATGSGFFA